VKINSVDESRVLIGMPFINTVFVFVVENNGTTLRMASSTENGLSVGYGKSVSWLSATQAAILVSQYSLDYQTFFSSKVQLYKLNSDTNLLGSPTAVIPNSQQPLPSTMNNELIRIVSTPSSLAFLDVDGGSMIILATPAGNLASTDTSDSPVAASMPVVSHTVYCIGGTFKIDAGVHPCSLCPAGSRNPATTPATTCLNCSSDNYCSWGALYEINASLLVPETQAHAYPSSPETDVFEDILLNNMFSLSSSVACLRVSPLFWTLILMSIVILLLIGMASLNLCMQPNERDQLRTKIKSVFQRTDLVVSQRTNRIDKRESAMISRVKANYGWVESHRWLCF
jgi:hypothetical protein